MANANLHPLSMAVMLIVVTAVAIAVGSSVVQDIEDGVANSSIVNIYNDTFYSSQSDSGNDTLDHDSIQSGSLTIYLVNSSNTLVANGNFTLDYDTGELGMPATAYTNDTFWASNSTLANASFTRHTIQVGSLVVYNVSTKVAISLDNFTIDYDAGTIGLSGSSAIGAHNDTHMFCNYTYYPYLNGTQMNANYQYATHPMAWNITQSGNSSLRELSSWFPTIALVVAAGVVLGILMVLWNRRRD